MSEVEGAVSASWRARLIAGLVLCVGCSGDRAGGSIHPTVESVNGLEIATLESIPGPLDPRYELTFEVVQQVRTVVDDQSEPLVFDATAVTELSSGHLLVDDDFAEQPLVVLDPASESVILRFGRKGQGPGEFGGGVAVVEAPDQSIVALDRANRNVHHFSSQGTWLESNPIEIDLAVGKSMGSRRSASFLVSALQLNETDWHRNLNRVDPSGSAVELMRLPEPSPNAEPGRIQRGRVLWTVLPHGVVTMWSDRPHVFVHDESGLLLREIHLPMERREISEEDIRAQFDHYGPIANTLRPGPAALTNEFYATGDSTFAIFLSGLWRSATDPPLPPGQIMWRVFTTGGAYVGVVPLPEDFRYLGHSDDAFWARTLDERGQPVLQKLRIVRPSDSNQAS